GLALGFLHLQGRRSFHLDGVAKQLREKHASEDQRRARASPPPQPLSIDKERGEPGKNRLEGKNQGSVGSCHELLRPGLHGESEGSAKKSGNDNRQYQAG